MILGKKRFITVAIAFTIFITIVGLTLLVLYSKQHTGYPKSCDSPAVSVVTAKVAIEAGAVLKKEDLLVKDVPKQFLPHNPLLAYDLEIYLGQPVNSSIAEKNMILTSDFAVTQRKFGVEDLPPGQLALKIEGEAIQSMAAGVRPRDYIDVMVTLTDGELLANSFGGQRLDGEPHSIVALQRVLVVDVEDDESARSITLSVNSDEAERLAIWQNKTELNILARDAEDEEYTDIKLVGLKEAIDDIDITNRIRHERNLTAVEGGLAMEIPEASIGSLPSNLEAGSRIDVLGFVEPGKVAMEWFEEASALTLLQNVEVRAAGESITVLVTHDEAHLLSLLQVATTFYILARHPEYNDSVPVQRWTIEDSLEDLDIVHEMRRERSERPAPIYCDSGYSYDSKQHRCVSESELALPPCH